MRNLKFNWSVKLFSVFRSCYIINTDVCDLTAANVCLFFTHQNNKIIKHTVNQVNVPEEHTNEKYLESDVHWENFGMKYFQFMSNKELHYYLKIPC